MRNLATIHIASAMVFALFGCSQKPETQEVEGRVLLGGQPLDRIEVIYVPDEGSGTVGPRSSAVTDQNGHYSLMTEDGKSAGAVSGKHRIIFKDLKSIAPLQDRLAMASRPGKGNAGQDGPGRGPASRGQLGRPGQPSNPAPSNETKLPPSRIPYALREINTTPMRKDVQAGKQTIDLELTGQ